jgi:O-antigen/teichoic acid export membrane protein
MTARPAPTADEAGGPAPASAPPPNLGARARRAVGWTAGFQIFRDGLQFGLMLVLVRLLPAEVYGQVGLITTFVGFAAIYSSREFLGHLLVARDEQRIDVRDYLVAGGVIQVSVCVLVNGAALGLRFLPAYAAVAPALHVMSLVLLVDLPSELRMRMLERDLDWRRLRLLHGMGLLATGALSIALALTGWGIWALLLPQFVVPLLFAGDLLAQLEWPDGWRWEGARFAPARRYGLSRIAAASASGAAGLIESSWLTAAAGFAAFGIFGRAVGLAQLLCVRVAKLLGQSVFPVLAKIEPGSRTYQQASAIYLRTVAWLVVPAAVFAGLSAEPVIRWLYGPQWLAATPLLPMALVVAVLGAILHSAYVLLLVHGRADRCVRADVWRLGGTVAALAGLAPFGFVPYLAGLSAVHLLSLVLVLAWLLGERAVSVAGLRDAFAPAGVAGLAAATAVYALMRLGPAEVDLMTLALRGLCAGATYVLVLRVAFAAPLTELVSYMPKPQRVSMVLRLKTSG